MVRALIKAIIFDCFGVLALSSYEPFKEKYLSHDKNLVDEFEKYDQASSAGEISQLEATEKFAELAGIDLEKAKKILSYCPPNKELLSLIRNELKAKYKIGFVSNVAVNRMDELFTKEDIALFDDVILSYQVNMAKPDIRIFKLSAKRLEVQPEECIFVDDIEKYLLGAQESGMQTVMYENFEKFKIDLEKLL